MEKLQTNGRILWLDAARVVAILSITLNHAVNRSYVGIYHEQYIDCAGRSLLSLAIEIFFLIFSHIGVPLFLMISGSLLLKKRMETKDDLLRFYRHNLLDLFITGEIWFFIMYWSIVLTDGESQTVGQLLWGFVKTMLFIDQTTMGSMWYIPMILCVYIVLPLLAMALQKAGGKIFVLPLAIIFISAFLIPNINSFLKLTGSDTDLEFFLRYSNLFSEYFLYIFFGYWVSCGGLQKLHTVWIALGTMLTFTATCAYQLFAFRCEVDYVIGYESVGILASSVFTFELIRRGAELVRCFRKPVTYLSEIAFGIYFVHIMIMQPLFAKNCFAYMEHAFYKMLALEAISFLGSVLVIYLLSKIPVLKRYLFLIKDGRKRTSIEEKSLANRKQ